ncbi:MAG TPA: Kazal-type serine protease inhibitor family protein [Labilithrix sp.]|jgi:hypothetical protein|nr:Kazal-type serine protease inhibitor family protein [Labilithrix sp.]
MKLANVLLPLVLLSFPLVAGCAAQTETSDDEVEVEAAEEALTSSPTNANFFQVTRRDFRKCAAPLCGGFYVKLVNQPTTLCANGKREADCYVSAIDLKGVGLSDREEQTVRAAVESGKALIKAKAYKRRWTGQWIGSLRATEAWLGATGSPADGTFYRAADNGIRCVKAPCPSTTAYQLNGKESHNVVEVNLQHTQIPADQATLDQAANALGTKEGILVAGGLAMPKCLPGSDCGPFINATEFYLRVTRREGTACGFWAGYACNPGQYCAWAPGDICGAADAPGKCTYKPEACIQLYQPVCGCDGKTHGNACQAASAGVSVSSDGPCEGDNP